MDSNYRKFTLFHDNRSLQRVCQICADSFVVKYLSFYIYIYYVKTTFVDVDCTFFYYSAFKLKIVAMKVALQTHD